MNQRATANAPRILVVDDEPDLRELLELTLLKMGLQVELADSIAAALKLADQENFDLCLTDMRLPDGLGLSLVDTLSQRHPPIPVAVITAFGSAENAVAALKAGAFDYLSKPLELDALRELVKNALKLPRLGVPTTKRGPVTQDSAVAPVLPGLTGISPSIQEVRQTILKLARSVAPVAIQGESGSGKELAARLIHQTSVRGEGAFVAVNCGAIPENLMEAEFFGYRKGAFTGADTDRDGFFQAAHGGTLFLDEVADLPLAMQVKLLRAIQERKVRKIGATQEESVDVRIISATHKDLSACVTQGHFRQDLYYRLQVITLRMPALRERIEDLPDLAEQLLVRIVQRNYGPQSLLPVLKAQAIMGLQRYAFPGNVRELENMLERALAFSGFDGQTQTEIDLAALGLAPIPMPLEATPAAPGSVIGGGDALATDYSSAAVATAAPLALALPSPLPTDLNQYLDTVEREILLEALRLTADNRTAAAKLLGISFRQMRYRLQRLGI
ncbi:sigma-54-dependent transcriptional regulator [Parvibium lacunae]|uniref:Sigma-54-dependent Fis family transcriptional regulator n=1 Tax=Parvibium lacunae TaxID=1888893 RepID=A0A368L235_9BURK|nr:sigma-54 dependent transcriptional regulator [Parvibium lacunae]RCS57450.1 sigma-54-dependent Fis family transcriptional regulator [Parvibium lacunae]